METLRNLGQVYFNLSPETQGKIINSLLIILALWVLRLLAFLLINRRFKQDVRALYSLRKAADYTAVLLGLVLVGRFWLEDVQSLATYLGLLSAGLAIALQDLVINLAGWLFIYWRRPFKVGDRIEIAHHAGDVIDVRLFEFSLLEVGNRLAAEQSTGRVLHIPNGTIFKEVLANFSQGLPVIWNEIPVLITFESNWIKAKELLTEIVTQYGEENTPDSNTLRQADRRFVITYANLQPTVYTQVEASGVLLTMRYMVDPRQRRTSEHIIWENVLHAFGPHLDIDFAYETRRQFQNLHEGKGAEAGNPLSE